MNEDQQLHVVTEQDSPVPVSDPVAVAEEPHDTPQPEKSKQPKGEKPKLPELSTEDQSVYERLKRNEQYQFLRPYKFEDGPEHTALYFPLFRMTGEDILAAEEAASILGVLPEGTRPLELSKRFQAILAARIAKVKPEYIFRLPARDFTRITVMVEHFLFSPEGE